MQAGPKPGPPDGSVETLPSVGQRRGVNLCDPDPEDLAWIVTEQELFCPSWIWGLLDMNIRGSVLIIFRCLLVFVSYPCP